MKFSQRLSALGFASYDHYLASPHWSAFKIVYQSSGRPMACQVCKSPKIQLHHHTYERLGQESIDDVTPLCNDHHEQVHKILKDAKKFVEQTAWAISVICGIPYERTKKPKRRRKKSRRPAELSQNEVREIVAAFFEKKNKKHGHIRNVPVDPKCIKAVTRNNDSLSRDEIRRRAADMDMKAQADKLYKLLAIREAKRRGMAKRSAMNSS